MTRREVLDALIACGISHVVGLPDNTSGSLMADKATPPQRIQVSREGEAFAVAAGLWIGGARPLVWVQNTGLLESGDALRGTAVRMGIPLPCLVSFRGNASLPEEPVEPAAGILTDPTVDSIAVITEPTLAAWGIQWTRLRDATELTALIQRCRRQTFPEVALIDYLENS